MDTPRQSGEDAGAACSRGGLGLILGEALQGSEFRQDWRRTAARYRMFLHLDGQEIAGGPELGQRGRRGLKAEFVEAVVEQGGAMTLQQVLRHRVRYFCDRAVPGTTAFVNAVFERE